MPLASRAHSCVCLLSSLVRGYGQNSTAYYIQCHHCKERFEADPVYQEQWEEEFLEYETKMEDLRAAGKL